MALRRDGVIDPAHARAADAASRALKGHVKDYLAHLAAVRRSKHTTVAATKHLEWIQETTGATRLGDLTLEVDGLASMERSSCRGRPGGNES